MHELFNSIRFYLLAYVLHKFSLHFSKSDFRCRRSYIYTPNGPPNAIQCEQRLREAKCSVIWICAHLNLYRARRTATPFPKVEFIPKWLRSPHHPSQIHPPVASDSRRYIYIMLLDTEKQSARWSMGMLKLWTNVLCIQCVYTYGTASVAHEAEDRDGAKGENASQLLYDYVRLTGWRRQTILNKWNLAD